MGLPTTFRLNLAVWPSEHLQEEGFRTNTGLYNLSSWASSVSSRRRAGERLGERLRDRGEVDLQREAVDLSGAVPSKPLNRDPQSDFWSSPDPLHGRLRCGSLWGSSCGRLYVEFTRANGISFDVSRQGRVHALVFGQDHSQAQAGTSILKDLHLVAVTGLDLLSIFKPSNLVQPQMTFNNLVRKQVHV